MTASLAVKLVLTPTLVVAASLVARRWGSQVGGWLVGFPLTSGPVALVLLLEHGSRFATAAALSTIFGVISQAAFAVAYSWASHRFGWPGSLAAGAGAFLLSTLLFSGLPLSPCVGAAGVAVGLTMALLVTSARPRVLRLVSIPSWDLPARVAVAIVFIAGITALAGLLGPTLTGLLTPFPLYAAILAVFAQAQLGAESGRAVMRGLLVGLYGFAAFFLVLTLLLVPAGAWVAFAAAIATVAAVQALALLLSSRAARPAG